MAQSRIVIRHLKVPTLRIKSNYYSKTLGEKSAHKLTSEYVEWNKRWVKNEMIKERPIIFSSPMVRAILEGRKTMTRRPVKPQPNNSGITLDALVKDFLANSKIKCPYGQPGDRLWIRETWNLVSGHYIYKATDSFPFSWKPSIYMPRLASRITLEIINIRVERLQEITEEDAIKEGCPSFNKISQIKAIEHFENVWNSIYGKDSWNQNPWVWVIEFKMI